MKSISSRCIHQILNLICPGPCKSQLYESISRKLIKNDDVKFLIIMKFQSNIDTMFDNMFTMMINAKKDSLEKRIIRSLLTKSLKPSEIKRYCSKHEISSSFITGDMKKQSNIDYDSLICGEKISVNPQTQTQAKVKESIIEDAVCYILHKDHVIITSWGERTHHLSWRETITLPRLYRSRIKTKLVDVHSIIQWNI